MKALAVLLLVAATTAQADNQFCRRLSTSDAHVLTKKQLAARICSYREWSAKIQKDVKEKTAANEMSNGVAALALEQALDCEFTAIEVDTLYKERFGKNSGCVQYDDKKK